VIQANLFGVARPAELALRLARTCFTSSGFDLIFCSVVTMPLEDVASGTDLA
jgi:hypothetical protein